jgi:hypothetical protein
MHRLHTPYGAYGQTADKTFELSPDAKQLRRFFEDRFIEQGMGPGLRAIVDELGFTQDRAWDALDELRRAVQLMFVPGTENFLKMPPFSYIPTRHRVSLPDGRSWYGGCAAEASAMNGLFPGEEVVVRSACPDCWEPVTVRMKDRECIGVDPDTAVLHIGIHPRNFSDNWIVTCDNINFFKSEDHARLWEQAFPDKRGVVMPATLVAQMTSRIATVRHWDYDRGADAVGDGAAMVGRFAAMGVDVTPWR